MSLERRLAAATVRDALAAARTIGVERLDALALLEHALGRPRVWLIAHDDELLATADAQRAAALFVRRAAGEPLAYLVGEKEFHGLALRVTPDVLIPRPDTETLVEWALELLPADRPVAVADLGTGSGAIALAIAQARPLARITAIDASDTALAVARANGERLGLRVAWRVSDWWQDLAGQRFDLVVSNPPYIAEGDVHLAALGHEPQQALTSGIDGLDAIRRIVAGARDHLAPGGWLLFEHGFDQAQAVAALLASAGFSSIGTRLDLGERARCTGARAPG
ncbi:peptide chain release factor N(5)-glutamine methyltransferase [Caldimonas sp. KR1-144]|uniref:peptide chain release factor N(5)-glutamine methyltransferase n=1 Tax=Caldimonas sp. KR1-144 TaxID=3400911 RepID=UPI003C111D12